MYILRIGVERKSERMELVEIILSIVIIILGGYIYYIFKKLIPQRTEQSIGEIFYSMFKENNQSRIEWFKFLNRNTQPGGVLFVGDSITQEFLVTDYFQDKLVYNRGIGGDTTVGLLKRMKESIYDLKPKKMFLLIGTNDLAVNLSTPEVIVKNISKIVDLTLEHSPNTEIYVESVYPTLTKGYDSITEEALKERANYVIDILNDRLVKLCKEKGITYVDVNTYLKNSDYILKPEYTRDGLHLNTNGYEVVIEQLKPYF